MLHIVILPRSLKVFSCLNAIKSYEYKPFDLSPVCLRFLCYVCLTLLLFFSSFNFLFSLKVNLGFFITLLSLNDFPLYLFDINFIYFLSALEISAPVVGSSSIPNGVIFLGSGVNVESGLSS